MTIVIFRWAQHHVLCDVLYECMFQFEILAHRVKLFKMNLLTLISLIVACINVCSALLNETICLTLIQRMTNDSCCPLSVEQLKGYSQILNQVNDAIPIGVDDKNDMMYLGKTMFDINEY